MLRVADRYKFITKKEAAPYIQKDGKTDEKQEISTLMEKNNEIKKIRGND